MIEKSSVLGLILARGGSKGLPGKNTRLLRGKPLVAWSVEAAKRSKYLDAVVISTDSDEIANAAIQFGAEAPFRRPPELASDTASSMDAILHALDWLRLQGRSFDYVALLEPTSPLREPHDIDQALELLQVSSAQSIVSVCQASSVHPAFMYRLHGNKSLTPYLSSDSKYLRRQDIEPLYFLDGTIYIAKTATLSTLRSFYHDQTLGFEVPKWKSPEIDDEIDFLYVEAIMKHRGIGT
jgi:CMP-N,N'-diacetyllegionaminic acid synthase